MHVSFEARKHLLIWCGLDNPGTFFNKYLPTSLLFFFLLKIEWLSRFFEIMFGSRSCWRQYPSVGVLAIRRK